VAAVVSGAACEPARPAGGSGPVPRAARRRGVSSVLSMMFLVIFGTLGVAMAVVAQGNLRSADSSLRVSRAMSAAETGLAFAARRLEAETARFVVRRGVIDGEFAQSLWEGTFAPEPDDPDGLEVLPPVGYEAAATPAGIAEALLAAHLADGDSLAIDPGDASLPSFDAATGRVVARPIRLGPLRGENDPAPEWLPGDPVPLHFRVSYRLLPGEPIIRIESEGRDGEIRRSVRMDFRLDKRIEYAVLGANRIMIGKNVRVEGPLGTTFGLGPDELNDGFGQPLLIRSDFAHLDATGGLDAWLEELHREVTRHDADHDRRLRLHHPMEGSGAESLLQSLAGIAPVDPNGGAAVLDRDANEYVDEFDLFLLRFDADEDGGVVWSPALAAAAGLGLVEAEFEGIDDQLARLIDLARPDRNGDGRSDAEDVRLGWNDGVIDAKDRYAKVHGSLLLAVTEAQWEDAAGPPWQRFVEGPIRAGDASPITFGVSLDDARVATPADFPPRPAALAELATTPLPPHGDGSEGGEAERLWESVPYGSPQPYDWYDRPVYRDTTFTNLRIPEGSNALFVNCRFVGVVYIETEMDCDHVDWNYAGALEQVTEEGGETYRLRYPDIVAESGGEPVPDTRTRSNNLRFHDCVFVGTIAADTPSGYAHWRNKVQFTGSTRFHTDASSPDLFAEDGGLLATLYEGLGEETHRELRKSSMMLPGWSVDVGPFGDEAVGGESELPVVRLRGTIVAGVLDIRGTADIHGTLLMTFKPEAGEGPLHYGGRPDAFNTTIGYFGPEDGDFEGAAPGEGAFGEISLRWDPLAELPDGIPWPLIVESVPGSYREARATP
jgi:hypothetical protein